MRLSQLLQNRITALVAALLLSTAAGAEGPVWLGDQSDGVGGPIAAPVRGWLNPALSGVEDPYHPVLDDLRSELTGARSSGTDTSLSRTLRSSGSWSLDLGLEGDAARTLAREKSVESSVALSYEVEGSLLSSFGMSTGVGVNTWGRESTHWTWVSAYTTFGTSELVGDSDWLEFTPWVSVEPGTGGAGSSDLGASLAYGRTLAWGLEGTGWLGWSQSFDHAEGFAPGWWEVNGGLSVTAELPMQGMSVGMGYQYDRYTTRFGDLPNGHSAGLVFDWEF
ncbi:MAG: hypothetical protein JRH16_23150 [Deltaproteobacteria bacterium]|nr:hypothetical protein [Deltaproteobacteria bacterium]